MSESKNLIQLVTEFSSEYMKKYKDPSHDFAHVLRVKNMAMKLASIDNITDKDRLQTIAIAALLHDVADHKLAEKDENRDEIITDLLKDHLDMKQINTICNIVKNVSYTNEITIGRVEMKKIVTTYPDLVYVLDADRIDSIGALGVLRASSYGGFKNRPLQKSIDHFDEKLFKLGNYVKTDAAKAIMEERIQFMKMFKAQYESEL
jgi:uncharacterized protein